MRLRLTIVQAEATRRSFRRFAREAWPYIDPAKLIWGWHMDALCLAYETPIMTEAGPLPIGALVELGWAGNVLSFCHETGELQWKPIKRLIKSAPQDLYDVRLSDGRVLQISGNHPIYTREKGYLPTAQVQPGQGALSLRPLSDSVHVENSSLSDWPVLQFEMLRSLQSKTGGSDVPVVRQGKGMGRRAVPSLCLQAAAARDADAMPELQSSSLQDAWQATAVAQDSWSVLWVRVSRAVHYWAQKLGLSSRGESGALPETVPGDEEGDQTSRRGPLLSVLLHWAAGRASYRQRPVQQRQDEPCRALSVVPQQTAGQEHAGENGVGWCTVVSVERSLRIPGALYNLEVADNNNYFADGILVHNCDHLSYVSTGEVRFLLVNIPPRTSKSRLVAGLYPVWDWLQDPTLQFLTASYALQLSMRDALSSRRLMDSPWFQQRWGHRFRFSFDEKLKRQYSNDKGGRRIAIATESATTGEGGNRLIVDDPHNATDVESETKRKGTHDWWDHAMVNRMNRPEEDAWIVCGQRTAADDLFGHIEETTDMRQVVKLVLPNEFEPRLKCITYTATKKKIFEDPRKLKGELLCPQRTGPNATKRLKKAQQHKYALQYQQNPKGSQGKILKRDSWRSWEGEVPECRLIIQVYDTAFEEGEENDYSARTDWGLFVHNELLVNDEGESIASGPRLNIILLGAWRDKLAYGKLRVKAVAHAKKTQPDEILVEKKATGIILARDLAKRLHKQRTSVKKISLAHGPNKLDKVERAHLASPMLDEGLVWYPAGRQWPEEVIDECANFPDGKNDDYVDTVTMALVWLRRQVDNPEDWEAEASDGSVRLFKRKRAFYG